MRSFAVGDVLRHRDGTEWVVATVTPTHVTIRESILVTLTDLELHTAQLYREPRELVLPR